MIFLANESTNGTMPVWAWILILGLGILGLVVAIWGFAGSFRVRVKDHKKVKGSFNLNIIDEILKSRSLNLSKLEQEPGVYVMVCGIVNITDFFIPMYLFETEDIKAEVKNLLEEINENKTEFANKVNQYMEFNEISKEDIKFAKVNFSFEETLKETKLDKRGFSK